MNISWLCHECIMNIKEYVMIMSFICQEYFISISWNGMNMSWKFYEYVMILSWVCHEYIMNISWVFHEYIITMSWIFVVSFDVIKENIKKMSTNSQQLNQILLISPNIKCLLNFEQNLFRRCLLLQLLMDIKENIYFMWRKRRKKFYKLKWVKYVSDLDMHFYVRNDGRLCAVKVCQ